MRLVVPVGEVEPRHVHARVDELPQVLHRPARLWRFVCGVVGMGKWVGAVGGLREARVGGGFVARWMDLWDMCRWLCRALKKSAQGVRGGGAIVELPCVHIFYTYKSRTGPSVQTILVLRMFWFCCDY